MSWQKEQIFPFSSASTIYFSTFDFSCCNSRISLFNSIFRFTHMLILLWTHTISCLSKDWLFNNLAKALFPLVTLCSATLKPAFSRSILRSIYLFSHFLFVEIQLSFSEFFLSLLLTFSFQLNMSHIVI